MMFLCMKKFCVFLWYIEIPQSGIKNVSRWRPFRHFRQLHEYQFASLRLYLYERKKRKKIEWFYGSAKSFLCDDFFFFCFVSLFIHFPIFNFVLWILLGAVNAVTTYSSDIAFAHKQQQQCTKEENLSLKVYLRYRRKYLIAEKKQQQNERM